MFNGQQLQASSRIPIHTIPPEILDHVMMLYLDDSRSSCIEGWVEEAHEPAVILSHVCSYWHSRSLNNPILWSRIFIQMIPEPNRLPHRIQRIESFIARSHPMPLSLRIGEDRIKFQHKSNNDLELDTYVPAILSSLLSVKDRWKTCSLVDFVFHQNVFPAVCYPALEFLIIRECCDTSGHPTYLRIPTAFKDAPNLRHVDFTQTIPISHLPFSQLKKIRIWTGGLYAIIYHGHSMPYLESLGLLDDEWFWLTKKSIPPFTLQVQRLDINSKFSLTPLITPNLKSLDLLGDHTFGKEKDIQRYFDFINRSNCGSSLTELRLTATCLLLQDMVQIFISLPNLQDLTISWGWSHLFLPNNHLSFFEFMGSGGVEKFNVLSNLHRLRLQCLHILDPTHFLTMIEAMVMTKKLRHLELDFIRPDTEHWSLTPPQTQEKWTHIRGGLFKLWMEGKL